MGTYLIPNAKSIQEAINYLMRTDPTPPGMWRQVAGGVEYTRDGATDAEVAALYAGFTPTWPTAMDPPLPTGVGDHLQHLRDYYAADPATITNAQTVHVVKDLIKAVQYLNNRLE